MDEEIDLHHIDCTSPMMEREVDILSPAACLYQKPQSQSSSTADMGSQSSSREEIDCMPSSSSLMTAASTSTNPTPRPQSLPRKLLVSPRANEGLMRGADCRANSLGVGTCVNVVVEEIDEQRLRAPIVGYEIMEQRAKFTVFKIHVRKSDRENWLIFRRYTDFVRVNDKLKEIFPIFRLSLPPKRWFGSNFDPNFLEDRQLGLQAFIDNILGHKDIVLSGPVREFLCLDDPPGPLDSLEESRALCESLDETVYNLHKELADRDKKIAMLSAELETAQQRIGLLNQHLQNRGNIASTDSSLTPVSGESSTIEGDIHSQAEADQSMSLAQSGGRSSPPALSNKGGGDDGKPGVQHSSTIPLGKEPSPSSSDEHGSQQTLRVMPRKNSNSKQGETTEKDGEQRNSQPDIITVT